MISTEQFARLENDPNIKTKYLKWAAFGQNKLIYPFIIIGIFSLFFVGCIIFDGLTKTVGIIPLIIVTIVGIICLFVANYINKKAIIKLDANTNTVPIAIGKKIYGNDDAEIYHVIYSVGNRRHDLNFINGIANKIFEIDSEPNKQLRSKVKNIFSVKLTDTNRFAKELPTEVTSGEIVYTKQFDFKSFPDSIKTIIRNNNDNFLVVAMNASNPGILIEPEYYN